MTRPTVLVIEDDRRYRDLLDLNLTRHGYGALLAPDGLTGLNLLERDAPELVILDLMLPDIDGYEICRRIREYSDVPIIILSARAEAAQKVRGLQAGADDYVTKPFAAEELLARVAAVLRRREGRAPEATAVFVCGELVVDFPARRVTVGGREVHLTPSEYRLLQHLVRNAGRVLVQEELLRRVWGPGYEEQPEVLHTTVRRLRRKLEPDPAAPRYVLTRRSIGYELAAPCKRVEAAPRRRPPAARPEGTLGDGSSSDGTAGNTGGALLGRVSLRRPPAPLWPEGRAGPGGG